MKAFALLICAGVTLILGATESCAEEEEDLAALGRRLTAVQSRFVTGDLSAKDEAQKQLKKIEARISSLDPEALRLERNLREIAFFLLAGGSSTVVRKLFSDGVIDQANAPLVAAALAYADGHRSDAIKKFDQIKEQEYPSRLSGHIALVKGGLFLGSDKKRATASLDWARLVLPGSLVEEAALRRLVVALDMAADGRRYLMLVRRYADRYRLSPFAENFKNFVIKRSLENVMKLDEEVIEGVAQAIALHSQAEALDWRLRVLRLALSEGRVDMAAAQYEKASKLANLVNQSERMRLYDATLMAMRGKIDASELELSRVNKASLKPEENMLFNVVTAILRDRKSAPLAEPRIAAAGPDVNSKPLSQSPIILSAQKSLEAADAILKRPNAK